jgi:peptide/nickel transport system substrate-binding protein
MRRRLFLGSMASVIATTGLAMPAIAQQSRTLRYVPNAALTVLDPVMSTANGTVNHGYHVFDTLYAVDRNFVPRPQMAAGHSVSDDGLTWTITLREGLLFHDGSRVRATDCIASLQRWMKRDAFGQSLAAAIAEWQAPDDRTLRLRLTRRFPLLLDVLAKPTGPAFVMPEHLARTDIARPIAEMIGSGPFRFLADEFMVGSRVAYRRFEGYVPRPEPSNWASGGKVARVERIEWQIIPDPSTAAAALQTGDVDWWEVALHDLVPVLARNREIVVDQTDPTGFLAVLRFNTLQPPFDNPALRRAVLRAVDQREYLALLGDVDDAGTVRPCHSFFPCGTTYGAASTPDPMTPPATIAEARKLVAAAGYRGERIVIINPSDVPTITPLGQMTFDLFCRLGMNAELVVSDWASVLQRRGNRGPIDQGGWNVFHTWNTGASMANPMQNSTLRGQGARGWFGWYDSPAMEAMAAAFLSAETAVERRSIAAAMQAKGLEDAPTVPLGQFFLKTAYRRGLTGIQPAPVPFPWGVAKA